MSDIFDSEAYAQADAFDDPDENTSPEVVLRSNQRGSDGALAVAPPIVALCMSDLDLRTHLADLLGRDGWKAVTAKSIDELLEVCSALNPELILIDSTITLAENYSLPEMLRNRRPDLTSRIVGILPSSEMSHVASAVIEGYDDFIVNAKDEVEVLARSTANLRACRALSEIQKQRRDAATMLELTQTLASSLDLQLILHTVSRLIAEVIEVERCSILILDPDRLDAVIVAASEDRTVRDLRIQLTEYPELQRCVSTAAPVFIEDARLDPILAGVREKTQAARIRMMALFPIVFEERVMGVLFLRSHKVSRPLSEHEIRFGQTVSSACAVAIRNARLFDSFRDQTERINYMRLVAEKQMEAFKKYEDFFEHAADGMAIVNTETEVIYVNRRGRALLGREREEVKGRRFIDFLADESKERWAEVVDLVRLGRFHQELDFTVLRGDHTDRVFSLSASGGGQDTGLIIISYRDVTETREMEMELRTTKDFLENLIDNSVDAIVAADMRGNIMLFNKGAERIYGHQADSVIGNMHVSHLYQTSVAQEIMRQLRDERWGGRGRLAEQRKSILNVSGEVVPVSMTASIIYEGSAEVATVGVFTDLRERLTIERQLNEAQTELLKTEKARVAAELAGMAAHELNQPLTSVLGYAEMLRHRIDETEKRVRRPVDIIYSQAERMAEIVRKIGRITKYETTNYSAQTMMINLDASSGNNKRYGTEEATPEMDRFPSALEQQDEVTGPHLRARGPFSDDPGDDENTIGTKIRDHSLMANLASLPRGEPHAEPSINERRASVVRMDTVGSNMRDSSPGLALPRNEQTTPNQPNAAEGKRRRITQQVKRAEISSRKDDEDTRPGVRMSDLLIQRDKK
jgi:PAS domain S-box-containing protein